MGMAAYTLPPGLPDLTDITRYCRIEDIEPFLQMISTAVKSDHDRIIAWKCKKEELVGAIARTEGPSLKLIHEELNQLELERFLLIPSVHELHRS